MPRPARSKLEQALDDALHALYPLEPIKREVPIKVGGRTLYVDRILEGPALAIEADGRQHDVYTEHFHGDASGFKASKQRDGMKADALKAKGYTVIRFAYNETITAKTLRTKILQGLAECQTQ